MTQEQITRLVKASGVSAGELILLHFWGEDGQRPWLDRFAAAVASLGASPVVLQQSRTGNRALFGAASEEAFSDRYFERFSGFDAVLDLFAQEPLTLGEQLPPEQQKRYHRYLARLFAVLMKSGRFAQLRLPTAENAAAAGLEPEDFRRRMTEAYDVDYGALCRACEREAARFSGVTRVALRTGQDCVLHLDLNGRRWSCDAGDGDLPAGEVYIAPVEEQTNGSVFFDTLFLEGRRFSDVMLRVENGAVCEANDPAVWDWFAARTQAERVVCELGIGLNAHVTELCGYSVLDEKAAGTFHIAVGANNLFGGQNAAADHVDFVGPRQNRGGSMTAGQKRFDGLAGRPGGAGGRARRFPPGGRPRRRIALGEHPKNVFSLFRDVHSAAQKANGGEEQAARRFFAEKLGVIPASWETALQRAERQEDTDRARIERVKLDAAGEIRTALAALWRKSHDGNTGTAAFQMSGRQIPPADSQVAGARGSVCRAPLRAAGALRLHRLVPPEKAHGGGGGHRAQEPVLHDLTR